MSELKKISVAVDGPAGAGKSSISKIVAKQLGYLYIDTGAMYRGITWALLQQDVDLQDATAVEQALAHIDLQLDTAPKGITVYINGQNVTKDIRTQAVNESVSIVAAHKAVRQHLVKMQRAMAAKGGVILDGRDIGSVVLPQAELKIYLTASVETRGMRRWLEVKDSQEGVTLESICDSVAKRDYMDKNRDESPLVCVDDAVVINSDYMTIDETVQTMVDLIQRTVQGLGGA